MILRFQSVVHWQVRVTRFNWDSNQSVGKHGTSFNGCSPSNSFDIQYLTHGWVSVSPTGGICAKILLTGCDYIDTACQRRPLWSLRQLMSHAAEKFEKLESRLQVSRGEPGHQNRRLRLASLDGNGTISGGHYGAARRDDVCHWQCVSDG